MNNLLTVSLRNSAIYIPKSATARSLAPGTPREARPAVTGDTTQSAAISRGAAEPSASADITTSETATSGNASPASPLTHRTTLLIANLAKLGYGVTEPLLKALNQSTAAYQSSILEKIKDIAGVNKNWTPLVKGWDVPTGETYLDHLTTWFTSLFQGQGRALACGHIIPPNTFPLHRYNGCPFCGMPLEKGALELNKQGSKQKVLDLWTVKDAGAYYKDLLASKTALDATQMDSLKILVVELTILEVEIGMKETRIAVIDALLKHGDSKKAQSLFDSPTDILRYLWYKHTGFMQLIEPKTILKRQQRNRTPMPGNKNIGMDKLKAKTALKLKYGRKECRAVAGWINDLPLDVEKMCETMHAKRGMWVRFIRALRLAEYGKHKGFEKLARLLDLFYREEYTVWQGQVETNRLRYNAEETFSLLKQRPGLFARSLFSNMLWFGSLDATAAFEQVVDKVPVRLLFTLAMYAEDYFDTAAARLAKPLGGIARKLEPHPLITMYSETELAEMRSDVAGLCLTAVRRRFAVVPNSNKTIYIDPALFQIPVSIGQRSETVQDSSGALMGTRFPLLGKHIRLFMQWGVGLPAQHLDMDLSCMTLYDGWVTRCSYSQLNTEGCKHSGDIRSIPHKVGTAEYIEIDVNALKKAGANYVVFTCNAYSAGELSPNLVVGWMDSANRMKISETTGVAYDPSCVQHQVRIREGLTKGLVFGVLDVRQDEIIWLEMPFDGAVVQNMNTQTLTTLLKKLDARVSIGQLLQLKAEAQQLNRIETEAADEAYTTKWALNSAAVTALLID